MRVLLFGITGYTGGNLARELISRGHEVVGVARSIEATTAPAGVELVAGSVFDGAAVAELAIGMDAMVVAVKPLTDSGPLSQALPGLIAAAESAGARLAIVGGAASLQSSPGGPLVLENAPEAWLPEIHVHIDVLNQLRASDTSADWFFLSPAIVYGAYAPGERRGTYRLGTEVAVVDENGESTIGGEDLATAMVDELENPTHHRMRFTVGY